MRILILILIVPLLVSAEELKPGSKVVINAATTNIRAKTVNENLQCFAENPIDYIRCGSGTTENAGQCFVDANTSFQIEYGLSNVESCSGSEGTADWQTSLVVGTGTIEFSKSIAGITENTSFTINCQRESNPTNYQKSLDVNVSGTTGGNCDSLPPINIARQAIPDEFIDLTNIPFGSATGVTARYGLNKNQYSALKFSAPIQPLNKKIFFENGTPAEGGPAPYTVVISTCPGVFSNDLGQACKASGQTPTIRWSTDPNNNSNTRCQLNPGDEYYLNIVHSISEGSGYELTACNSSSSSCGVLFAELF
ncbi:hypothetical protein [Marinicella sp. W31]|uniref:hypothetical protein n=1 Tax=Marinicella sp. W31 TaxID=3023713 RepID=UPI00375822CF